MVEEGPLGGQQCDESCSGGVQGCAALQNAAESALRVHVLGELGERECESASPVSNFTSLTQVKARARSTEFLNSVLAETKTFGLLVKRSKRSDTLTAVCGWTDAHLRSPLVGTTKHPSTDATIVADRERHEV